MRFALLCLLLSCAKDPLPASMFASAGSDASGSDGVTVASDLADDVTEDDAAEESEPDGDAGDDGVAPGDAVEGDAVDVAQAASDAVADAGVDADVDDAVQDAGDAAGIDGAVDVGSQSDAGAVDAAEQVPGSVAGSLALTVVGGAYVVRGGFAQTVVCNGAVCATGGISP